MAQLPSDTNLVLTSGQGPRWRILQLLSAFRRRDVKAIDRRLQAIVQNDKQWELLARLSLFDRAHHLGVYDSLRESGWTDSDLLLAATLHDVGKADERGRVRLAHRVAQVLLRRVSPGMLEKLASSRGNRMGHGFYLAVNHASLGAALAGDACATERCCQLIAGHHDDSTAQTDPELLALMSADRGTLA